MPSDQLVYLSDDATLYGPASAETPNTDSPPADDPNATTPDQLSGEDTADGSDKTGAWRTDFEQAADPLDLLRRISKSVSREELLKDPTLAGIIGDTADKLERKRQADRDREAQEQADREAQLARERELDELVDNEDILSLGERALEERRKAREQREAEAARQSETAAAGETFQTLATNALNQFVTAQPDALRGRMVELAINRQSAYSAAPSWDGGFNLWLGDVVGAAVENAKTDWEKNLRAAIRAEVLGEIESGDEGASPEFGSGGTSASGQLVTQAEFDANRHNPTWRRNNIERLNRSIAAGHITG